jgi:hypothetical protein
MRPEYQLRDVMFDGVFLRPRLQQEHGIGPFWKPPAETQAETVYGLALLKAQRSTTKGLSGLIDLPAAHQHRMAGCITKSIKLHPTFCNDVIGSSPNAATKTLILHLSADVDEQRPDDPQKRSAAT